VKPTALLEAQALAAARGRATLFAGLSFRLHAGQVLVVRGPNGSGKTTLLRILAGLTAAVDGAVSWCGARVQPFDARLRRDVAYLGHAHAVKDELTAEENLRALLALAGEPATPETLRAGLAAASLDAQRDLPARALSQGQRRRIGLARLAALARPLWVLDEPTTALDDSAIAWLVHLIGAHTANGGIVVAATHQPLLTGDARVATLTLG
jgi:heme exporter protein A